MSLRYGMRLGRGLGVRGGGGILAFYVFCWVLEISVVTIITIVVLIVNASGRVIQSAIKKRDSRKWHQVKAALAQRIAAERENDLRKKHQDDVALAHRIAAARVEQVEYLRAGRTNPPALWGVYLVEPSCGPAYAKCGRHPITLKKLWLENRQGSVHEVLVLRDKPMAVAAITLLQSGAFTLAAGGVSIVSDFSEHGMPILRRRARPDTSEPI